MPFYVYVIQSEQDGSYYKGYTTDPLLRLQRHNNGETQSTRFKTPWKLVHVEIHETKTSALIKERTLKKWSRFL